MVKKKQGHDPEDLLGDPIDTLTIVNTLQLVGFFCLQIYVLAHVFGRAVWHGLAYCVRGIWLGLGFVVRAIDYVISAISGFFSWMIVGFFSSIVFCITAVFSGVWHAFVFVFWTIPVTILIVIGRSLLYFWETIAHVSESMYDYSVSLPDRALDNLSRARANIAPSSHWRGKLALFVGILILFALPFPAIRSYQFLTEVRAETETSAQHGLDALMRAKDAFMHNDYRNAQLFFASAHESFLHAQSSVEKVPASLRVVGRFVPMVGQQLSDGEKLLIIGLDSTDIGIRASTLAEQRALSKTPQEDFFKILTEFYDAFDELSPKIFQSARLLKEISSDSIPIQHRESFSHMSKEAESISALTEALRALRPVVFSALGDSLQRRYLLLFQNNTELRPTGGFLGSYALIDVYRGKLTNVEVPGGGSYDLQGQLSERVRAPQPLHLVNARWEFQDSNWFPDFPTSARKALWFYEKSGGPTVDGVIAINADFFQRLLSVIGSISMDGYGTTLTADNFFAETQKKVELEYDKKENKPKQFIADLFPKVLEQIGTRPESAPTLLGLVTDSFARRDIQVFLNNVAEQEQISSLGIAGMVRSAPLDYQMIVSANVGGGKSDAVITDTVARDTIVRDDGRIEGHITLTRAHNGVRGELFTGARNSSYLRFYLPRGTALLAAKGFRAPNPADFESASAELQEDSLLNMTEGSPAIDPTTGMVVTHEYDKSVFGHWLVVEPGEQKTATLSFVLPFTVHDLRQRSSQTGAYTLLLQRQSGSTISTLDISTFGNVETIDPFVTDHTIRVPLK